MTAQVAEILHYRGEKLSLCGTPLSLYLTNNPLPLDSEMISSACWRGYIGEWLIENGRLYLTALHEPFDDGQFPLSLIFKGDPGRIFVHWVTDELRCPRGKLLEYVHAGFASVHEQDLLLTIKQGELVSERIVQNGKSDEPGVPAGYGPGAWTVMPSDGSRQ